MKFNPLYRILRISKNIIRGKVKILSILIAFYSRSGKTKKIAELISNSLNCDYEEIVDMKKRTAFIIGYIKSGRDAAKEKLTTIKELQQNPELYDLIILGTPNWSSRMPPAIRTYINNNKSKFKKVAFFCTEIKKGGPKVLESMTNLCDKEPISTLELNRKEIKRDHLDKINKFIQEIKSN